MSFSINMSCIIRSGFNRNYIKHGKWMPVLRRSLDRSHSSTKKTSKRKTKKDNITESVSPAKIKDEGVYEKGEVKHGETYHATNVIDASIKEGGDGIKKETQTSEELVRKPAYPKFSDFLIRNIMSFPIHGPSDDIKEDYETEDSKYNSFPSVTTILSETVTAESKKNLERWKQNMIAKFGTEKFLEMQNDPVRKSKTRKNSKRPKKILAATLSRGKRLHSAISMYLQGKDVTEIELDENVAGCWKSVRTVFPHISDIKLVETWVYHPHLHYKGIVDCVACFKNVPHVIEWKQSEKPKKHLYDTFDAPIQLCAYMGTLPWCKTATFAEPILNGLVVIAYVDGTPADIFPLNSEYCQHYWEHWLRRVQEFWFNHSSE